MDEIVQFLGDHKYQAKNIDHFFLMYMVPSKSIFLWGTMS